MNRSFSSASLWIAIFLGVAITAYGEDAAPKQADKPAIPASDTVLTRSGPAKADSVSTAAPAPALPPETILVKVGDKSITQGDLDKETTTIEKMMRQRGLSEQQFASMLPTFKPQILDGLIIQSLIDTECTNKKITISADDIKKEFDTIKANLPKSQTLESLLTKQGITQAMLEEQIKEQLKVEKLLNISVSDEDVKKFYDENKTRLFETVRARHILIATTPTDDAAKKTVKKEQAAKLRKQLADGADFAKLAKENSDCPSKENGGELIPPFRRGAMAKPFEDSAFSLKNNEISQVVETDFGYHIIQTLGHQVQPFDEVKGRITAMLKGRKTQQEAEPLLKNLKDKAKITYLNGAIPPPNMMLPPSEDAVPPAPPPLPLDKPESK